MTRPLGCGQPHLVALCQPLPLVFFRRRMTILLDSFGMVSLTRSSDAREMPASMRRTIAARRCGATSLASGPGFVALHQSHQARPKKAGAIIC